MLYQYDYSLSGDKVAIIGVDEVGRGSLAGDVYVCAAHYPDLADLSSWHMLDQINDSKKIAEHKREAIAKQIQDKSISAIARGTAYEIDSQGLNVVIYNCMKKAVMEVVGRLDAAHCLVLVDGRIKIPDLDIPQRTIVKGDSQSLHIASASIIAKVARDRYMTELDPVYPIYQFARHKGYGTLIHRQAIREHGFSDVHRRSFILKA